MKRRTPGPSDRKAGKSYCVPVAVIECSEPYRSIQAADTDERNASK